MKTTALLASFVMTCTTISFTSSKAQAAFPHSPVSQAASIHRDATTFSAKVNGWLSHSHRYHHLRDDARALTRQTREVLSKSYHASHSRRELRDLYREVRDLDSKLHHMHDLIITLRREVRPIHNHHHAIQFKFKNGIQVHLGNPRHNNNERRVLDSLDQSIERLIGMVEHLREDLRDYRH